MPRKNNGHKVFTAAEATAMYELQTHEKVRAQRFEENLHNLKANRNPLTGQETPRVGEEQILMDTFDMTRSSNFVDKTFQVSGKIGSDETPKEVKMMDRTKTLRSKRDEINEQLAKAQEVLKQKEERVTLSYTRNRSGLTP